MKTPIAFISFLFLMASTISAQTTYKGFVDKYPVEFVVDASSDGAVTGIYAYDNFDQPIVLSGNLTKSQLQLFENNAKGQPTASFVFEQFDTKASALNGFWKDFKSNKTMTVTLHKSFDIETDTHMEDIEMLQPIAMKKQYFKIKISNEKRVSALKIFEKKTDRLTQQINLDCQLMGVNSVSIGDFNFDGHPDISIFESSYAGPNTSSLFYLFNPKTQQYYDSKFSGVSLEFDAKTKTITEHNQCCAGSQHTKSIYKVVNNKMKRIKEHCYIWDEKKQDLVERNIKFCK
jgi:hypothetical protein